MATLDGISLVDSAQSNHSGGAFLLTDIPKARLSVSASQGWKVDAAAGSRYVIAQGPSPVATYDAVRDHAFKMAQEGLDLWSVSRAANLGIKDAEVEHITWWPDLHGQVLRFTTAATRSVTLHATATVKDANGNIKPPPPVPSPVWHESLRYFRLSQVTDDLFDAYRNLYLAVESILDRIAPQQVNSTTGRVAEGEGAWFRRALGVAHSRVSLANFAPPNSADPVGDLYNELYINTRTALFHAKTSRTAFLPQSPGPDRDSVHSAVDRLARMFIALAESELGTRSIMSGLYQGGFEWMTSHLKSKVRLSITDDGQASDLANTTVNPTGGVVVNLTTRHAPELEEPFLRSFIGVTNDVGSLDRLRALVATVDDQPIVGGFIEGVLTLEGVNRFEGQLGIRFTNAQLPRKHFGS